MTLRVLFVCTANICRSPFMQAYARAALPSGDVEFSSAGTHGFVDCPMSEEMATEAGHWGLDVRSFRSRPLTPDLLDEADLVLTAEHRHRQFILDDWAHTFRKVLLLGQASRSASRLSGQPDAVAALAELTRRRGAVTPEDDVDDPYRRGASAQEAAARRMSAMLDPLLAVLGATDPPPSREPAHG